MKPTNITEYYSTHKDMWHENVTPEVMEGAVPNTGFVILEIIEPSPEALSSINKGGIILTTTKKAREPIVFKVLSSGSNKYNPEDLVCISFAAGDRFGDSLIVIVKEEDIIFKWGDGLLK